MRGDKKCPGSCVRGSGILGLLLVVLILMIVTVCAGSHSRDNRATMTPAEAALSRTAAVACGENLRVAQENLDRMHFSSPNEERPALSMVLMGDLKPCPEQGELVVVSGKLYCRKHSPPSSAP